MIERCKECGANLAMVGIRHRCIPGAAQALAAAKDREKKENGADNRSAGRKPDKSPRRTAAPADARLRGPSAVNPPEKVQAAVTIRPGRPKITDPRPWEVEGISKRTYYRRKAESEKEG